MRERPATGCETGHSVAGSAGMGQQFSGTERWACRVLVTMALALIAWPTHAGVGTVVPLYDGPSGATCSFFNAGARIAWRRAQTDWLDAEGRSQGERAYATAAIADTDQQRPVEWDVTRLLQQIAWQHVERVGLSLRDSRGQAQGRVTFHSREADDAGLRPVLEVHLRKGGVHPIGAQADTVVDCSTSRSIGQRPAFSVGRGNVGLVSFDLGGLPPGEVTRATLRLTTTSRQNGAAEIGIFVLDAPRVGGSRAPEMGLARRYPADRGIGQDPAVVVAIDHETNAWRRAWSNVGATVQVVAPLPASTDEPTLGRAMQVTIPTGKVTGANLRYPFKARIGAEPDEMYVRYYLRFDSGWDSRIEGGKLPGLAGTYNTGGWGGRKSNGTNGWSMRGYFQRQPEPENPLAGYVSIGTYAYHAEMPGTYGELWMWSRNALGVLERDRWYCIEQHVRLNNVGKANGVLRAWVDGELAFEKADIRFRTVDALKIEDFWLNVYHGGTKPVASDQRLYIDNIVIAREYIGPMVR